MWENPVSLLFLRLPSCRERGRETRVVFSLSLSLSPPSLCWWASHDSLPRLLPPHPVAWFELLWCLFKHELLWYFFFKCAYQVHTHTFVSRKGRSITEKKWRRGGGGRGKGKEKSEYPDRSLLLPFFPPLGIGGKRPHVPTTYRMSQKKTTLQGVPEKTFTGCPRKKLLPVLAPLVPLSEIQLWLSDFFLGHPVIFFLGHTALV